MNPKFVIAILGPGSSPHITRQALALAQRGHSLHVISEDQFAPFPSVEGVLFHAYPAKGSFVSKARSVKKIIEQIKPAVIHSHAVNHGGYAGVGSGFHPHVMTAWGSDILLHPNRSPLYRLETAVALRAADHVLSDAESVRDAIRDIAGTIAHNELLFWGVDTQHFKPGAGDLFRQKIGLTTEPFVLSPRIMTPLYNQDKMIEAFSVVLQRFPTAKLGLLRYLPGPSFENQLREQVRSLGMENNVLWLERFEYSELPLAYGAADLVLSIPSSDGTPLTVLEALACGSIVVASDLPALRAWIQHGQNGLLTPPENPADLAQAMIDGLSLSLETRQHWREKARALILERGNRERYLDRLEQIYAQHQGHVKPGMLQTIRNVIGL